MLRELLRGPRRSGCGRPRARTPDSPARARYGRTARSGGCRPRSRRLPGAPGASRLTTTGARPSDSSSTRITRGWETSACASTTICCSPPESRRQVTRQRFSSSGNSSSARATPLFASCLESEYVATRRLSSTVSPGNRRLPSGTIATPAPRTCSGRRRVRSSSPSSTRPLAMRSTPPTARTSDDFPAPFGPRSVVISPGGIVSETSWSTRRPPRETHNSSNRSSAPAGASGALT